MSANVLKYSDPGGAMRIEPLPDGRHKVSVDPAPGLTVARRSWVTSYPVDLIVEIHRAKGHFVCDEIMREESPAYVERYLRHEVLSYIDPAAFAGKRIMDFGCGSGASVMVLSRLLPACEIVGIELEEKLLNIARLRARHFGRTSIQLLRSPSGDSLPQALGEFDFVMFNAVFEHLLPAERPQLLPKIWSHLRRGGVLFLNQTPYRFSPIEVHTTGGVPFINYLPDSLALHAARMFSRRVSRTEEWARLLRRGIRGATVAEILGILGGPEQATLLKPLPHVGDRIDLWLNTLSPKHGWLKRSIWASLKAIKTVTRAEITPTLSLAIRRQP